MRGDPCSNPLGCTGRELCCRYCRACYLRWLGAGKPDTGPPPAMTGAERIRAAAEASRAAYEARLSDYRELRSWGEPVAEAARRTGISVSSAYRRYEPAIRRETSRAAA